MAARFGACLLASTGFSAVSAAVDVFLDEDGEGASWLQPFNRCLPAAAVRRAAERAASRRTLEAEARAEARARALARNATF